MTTEIDRVPFGIGDDAGCSLCGVVQNRPSMRLRVDDSLVLLQAVYPPRKVSVAAFLVDQLDLYLRQ